MEVELSEEDLLPARTPPEIVEAARQAKLNNLPQKSKERYIQAFDAFNAWRKKKY